MITAADSAVEAVARGIGDVVLDCWVDAVGDIDGGVLDGRVWGSCVHPAAVSMSKLVADRRPQARRLGRRTVIGHAPDQDSAVPSMLARDHQAQRIRRGGLRPAIAAADHLRALRRLANR